MAMITTSTVMESAEAANRLYGYFLAKGYVPDQISITDGATFHVSITAGEGTLAASHLFDFLNER